MADTREQRPPDRESDTAVTDTLHTPVGERYCPSCDVSYHENIERCPEDGTNLVRIIGGDDEVIGTVIDDRFTIKARIGQGGMGAVYCALQHSVGREVAVKLIHPRMSRDTVAVKRFLREAKLCSRLAHVGSVMVLDFGQCESGQLFMVMELLEGRTLAELLQAEGPLPADRVVDVTRQVCAALEAAHSLDIVHRDLKPSNIMVVDQAAGSQIVKVLDFGLAKSLGGDETTVTQSGLMMGTPLYTSPEVALGDRADTRSDLYSLGVIMYELLAGTPPFAGDTMQHLLHQHASEEPPPLPASVPVPLRDVVSKLLRKDPNERFESAAQLSAALRDIVTRASAKENASAMPAEPAPAQTSSRGGLLAAAALVALMAAAGIGYLMLKDDSPKNNAIAARPGLADAGQERHSSILDARPAPTASAPTDAATRLDDTRVVADAAPPKRRTPKAEPKVKLAFRTNPSRAKVVVRGKTRCVTPCSVWFPRGRRSIRVELKKAGYLTSPKSFTPDRSRSLPVIKLQPDFLGPGK